MICLMVMNMGVRKYHLINSSILAENKNCVSCPTHGLISHRDAQTQWTWQRETSSALDGSVRYKSDRTMLWTVRGI